MTSRSFGRTLRTPLPRLLTQPLTQRRTLVSAGGYVKAYGIVPRNTLGSSSLVFSRGMKTIDFAGHKETVYGEHILQLIVYPQSSFYARARGLAS